MKRSRIGIAFFWSVAAFAAAKIVAIPLYDPDLWWHLAAGREMLASGAILRADVFSHTMNGTPWLNFEWLGQILFFLIYDKLGGAGLFYLKVVAAPILLFMLAAILREIGCRKSWLLIGSWVGFLTLMSRVFERLELFSLFLFLAYVWLFVYGRRASDKTLRRLVPVPALLMVAWCNLHGGFVYGLGTAVLLNVGARWAGERRAYIRFLDFSILGMGVATLINPWGLGLYGLFTELLRTQGDLTLLLEWQPTGVYDLPYFWMVYLLAGAGLVRGLYRGDTVARFWAPVIVAFAVWGARYHRNAAISVIVLMPAISDLFKARPLSFMQRLPSVMIWILACVLLVAPYRSLARPWPQTKISPYRFPAKAAIFLEKNSIQGTVYNAYEFGGYLMWTRPQERIFMDGRYLFLGLLREEVRLDVQLRDNPNPALWQAYLDEKKVDYAVVAPTQIFVPPHPGVDAWTSSLEYRFPPDHWALVYWDDSALIYLKRVPRFMDLIERNDYRWVKPASLEWTQLRMRQDGRYREAALAELKRHQERTGYSVLAEHLMKDGEGKN